MRTFQFSGAGSHKFWNIEIKGNSFTVTYGKVGAKGQTQSKTFATDAEAEAAAEKLIKEKTSKGYRETTPSATPTRSLRDAMEEAIREDRSERANYMALSDHLQEQNDPRGEFIQVQLALEDETLSTADRRKLQKREKELLDTHREEWVGEWARHVLIEGPEGRGQHDFPGPKPCRFERGILSEVTIDRLTVACARAMNNAPQLRLVSRLYVGGGAYEEEGIEPGPDIPEGVDLRYDNPGLYVLARWPGLSNLRVFQLGWTSDEVYEDFCNFQCHLSGELAYDLVKQMPKLEELYLFAHRVDVKKIFKMDLPHLRIVQIYHSYDSHLDVLAKNASMKNLTHILIHPHALEYGSESYTQLKDLRAVLRSPHLSSLTHLRLRCSTVGDKGCEEIVKSGILKRLKHLDLRHGCIKDAGARALAECPDLKNLQTLDLSRNMLTAEGIAAIQATGVSVDLVHQYAPAEPGEDGEYDYEEGRFLYEADYE